ncbi:hypothetical protein DH2020_024840 [Rehmannia glutinosa]|uniref:Terpene synthase N-terminal domain-containing protein n=1 Tax=Rehmannia glutinosa TaxID=99300 RepID=A0ABR0W1E0_REHGL
MPLVISQPTAALQLRSSTAHGGPSVVSNVRPQILSRVSPPVFFHLSSQLPTVLPCNAVQFPDLEQKEPTSDRIRELVELTRSILQSMGDGEISISPYDTAWVALVEDIHGGGLPQFPSSLDWISKNQLSDGSWGDRYIFSIYDRIINTLACVVALRSWNIHPDKSDKGISFIKENIHKLEDENEEHMPIGFEVALPSLIEIAKKLDIDIPNDSKGLQEIYAKRELKLTRYWTNKGICWARNSPVQDIDDTAMGFRLMRLHGYDIFAGRRILLLRGQSTQAVTGMYNLYRASQLKFPGEKILEDAGKFSGRFLQEKRANNELLDKWIITKDLPGEQLSREQKHAFVKEIEHGSILKYANGGRYKTRSSLVGTLLKTLNQLSLDILLAHGRDIHPQLNHAWHKWLKTWEKGGEIGQSGAELFVRMLNLCGGGKKGSIWVPSEELISSHPKYEQLLNATINVCNQLRLFRHRKVHDSNGCMTNRGCITTVEIESEMQELVKLVITKSDGDLDSSTKQNFLTVARSFYYAAYFSPGTINYHIAKVLFEKVL